MAAGHLQVLLQKLKSSFPIPGKGDKCCDIVVDIFRPARTMYQFQYTSLILRGFGIERLFHSFIENLGINPLDRKQHVCFFGCNSVQEILSCSPYFTLSDQCHTHAIYFTRCVCYSQCILHLVYFALSSSDSRFNLYGLHFIHSLIRAQFILHRINRLLCVYYIFYILFSVYCVLQTLYTQ